jgi:hypothetical protein
MFRATGHDRIVRAAAEARKNFRQAKFRAVWGAPSFYGAHRSLTHLQDRVELHRKILEENRKARADGVVTAGEARRIRRLQRRQIRLLRTDIRRIINAGTNLKDVIVALDLDEMTDIAKSFLFQMLAVLSAGNGSGDEHATGLGAIVARWCILLNLASLALDVLKKLDYPLSRTVLGVFQRVRRLEEQQQQQRSNNSNDDVNNGRSGDQVLANTGRTLMYLLSGLLLAYDYALARHLNAALLSSAVVVKGLRTFVRTVLDWDDDDDDGIWPAVERFLGGVPGGIVMIALAAASLWARRLDQRGQLPSPPGWIGKPLVLLEEIIDVVAKEVDSFV